MYLLLNNWNKVSHTLIYDACACVWISDTVEEDDDLYDYVEDDDDEGDEIYEDLMRTEQVPEAVRGEHTLLFTGLDTSFIFGNPWKHLN